MKSPKEDLPNLAMLGSQIEISDSFPSWPIFDDRELNAIESVVKSGDWWSNNTIIEEFETAFSNFQEVQYTLSLTNGTQAIELVLRALRIGPGDEVIIPAYTCIATAAAVFMAGATPVLADIKVETITLDPESFRKAITSRTRAVILVHLAGVVGPIDEMLRIAERNKILVIEDCAHAHGAQSNGQKVGNFGIAGTFSFQASKTMTSGEGGAIVTNSEALYKRCWSLRNLGRLPGKPINHHYLIGSNFRITPFQAAILKVQLQRSIEQIPLRLANARALDNHFREIDGIEPQYRAPQDSAPGYLYIFHYQSKSFNNLSRALFVKALNAEGIPCSEASYPAIHHSHAFKQNALEYDDKLLTYDHENHHFNKSSSVKFISAEYVEEKSVWLPHRVLLGSSEQMKTISDAVRRIKKYSHVLADN